VGPIATSRMAQQAAFFWPGLRWVNIAHGRSVCFLSMNQRPPLIAIIDDDFAVRESLATLLEANGYSVLACRSGADLFGSELAHTVACLVVDVEMPGEDGFEVLSRLRRQGSFVPVIFISGRASAAMRAKAKSANVDLLDKPTTPRTLLAKINDLLDQRTRHN
jgi:two-component system response regulator FixJ